MIRKLVFGTLALLASFLAGSTASETINTSFVERNNGTDRGQNARKRRNTYCFSKNLEIHIAVSYFVGYGYNFMWPVLTLELKGWGERRSKELRQWPQVERTTYGHWRNDAPFQPFELIALRANF